LVRWHRDGFRRYWRWKSRSRVGRPQIETELRALIRQNERGEFALGCARIHGELLKLGLRSRSRASLSTWSSAVDRKPSWSTFLRNHRADIAAMDLSWSDHRFKLLYASSSYGLIAEISSGST